MLAPMYSSEQDRHKAAAQATYDKNTSYLQPRAAGRAFQLPAHQQRGQVDPAGVQVQQPRRASKKKHGARPPSRRSSTTVVATDVANFRAMVQELTGFPAAGIFRPLPRRVHAAVGNPLALAAGNQAGCGVGARRGQGSETTTNTAGSLSSSDAPPAVQPVTVMAQPPPGVFDGLSDIGSPELDSWADLSIE